MPLHVLGGRAARGSIAALCALALATTASDARAVDPAPSFRYLVTGNGFGFQVFDADQNAIVQLLEHPYRFLRPNPQNPDWEGVVRRDLAFDLYFGVRVDGSATWLKSKKPTEIGYVDQSNVIRSVVTLGDIRAESYFFAPYGYEGNAMVMLLRVANTGSSARAVDAFSIANLHMGSAPSPDSPQANGETIRFQSGMAVETGPGGGAVAYVPIGGLDISSCAAGQYEAVAGGSDLTEDLDCAGTDQVNLMQRSLGQLAPGADAWWGQVVLYDENADAAGALADWQAFLGETGADQLVDRALAEWESWRTPLPGGLTPAEARIWRQSEAVLRMGQTLEPWSESPKRKNHGMVLASLPPGGWHSGWVRDAAYGIVAMARTGHHQEARWAVDFFLNAEANKFGSYLGDVDYRITTVRYFGNGEEEADFSGQPTRNVEIDGWGLYLWAARAYLDSSGDASWLDATTRYGENVYEVLRDLVAEPLAANMEDSGMAIADASIWEVHWGNRQHFLYTTAAAARGFCDMAAIARVRGDLADRDRYKALSDKAVEAIRNYFVDQNGVLAGSLEQLASGQNYRDGAVIEALNWRLIPDDDRIAQATMADMAFLRTPVGGYKRVEGSTDQYDTDEWIFIDLRAADAWRRQGNTARADELMSFVTGQAAVNFDLIPELFNTRTSSGAIGAYSGSIPMVGYGAGLYQLSILERLGIEPNVDCGTVDPATRPDAGTFDAPDAAVGGDGGQGAGASGDRTGLACICAAAASPAGAAAPLLLVLFGLALVLRPRRS